MSPGEAFLPNLPLFVCVFLQLPSQTFPASHCKQAKKERDAQHGRKMKFFQKRCVYVFYLEKKAAGFLTDTFYAAWSTIYCSLLKQRLERAKCYTNSLKFSLLSPSRTGEGKGLDHICCEDKQRSLWVFSLENRGLQGLPAPQGILQGGYRRTFPQGV